jgi:hypothetical protein
MLREPSAKSDSFNNREFFGRTFGAQAGIKTGFSRQDAKTQGI